MIDSSTGNRKSSGSVKGQGNVKKGWDIRREGRRAVDACKY
jgi:hypothetical protein